MWKLGKLECPCGRLATKIKYGPCCDECDRIEKEGYFKDNLLNKDENGHMRPTKLWHGGQRDYKKRMRLKYFHHPSCEMLGPPEEDDDDFKY